MFCFGGSSRSPLPGEVATGCGLACRGGRPAGAAGEKGPGPVAAGFLGRRRGPGHAQAAFVEGEGPGLLLPEIQAQSGLEIGRAHV